MKRIKSKKSKKEKTIASKSLDRRDDRFYHLKEHDGDFGVSSAVYMYWNF